MSTLSIGVVEFGFKHASIILGEIGFLHIKIRYRAVDCGHVPGSTGGDDQRGSDIPPTVRIAKETKSWSNGPLNVVAVMATEEARRKDGYDVRLNA